MNVHGAIMKNITDDIVTKMSTLLAVAADETRLKILIALLDGEKNVSELQIETDSSQSLISHQLKILKKNKLVSFRKEKNYVYYFLDDEHVKLLIDVALKHCEEEK